MTLDGEFPNLDLDRLPEIISEYKSRHDKAIAKRSETQQELRREVVKTRDRLVDIQGKIHSSKMKQLELVQLVKKDYSYLSEVELKYKKLEKFKGIVEYLGTLTRVIDMIDQVHELLLNKDESAIVTYKDLNSELSHVHVSHLNCKSADTLENIYKALHNSVTAEFENELASIGWPKVQGEMNSKTLEQLFNITPSWKPKDVSIPVQILLKTPLIAFQFHFLGDRPTNRIEKPEWYLYYTIEFLQSIFSWFEDNIQSISIRLNVDAFREFVMGYCLEIKARIELDLPKLKEYPALLAHTIHQLIAFNKSVYLKFQIAMPCLSKVICHDADCFDLWLQFELSRSVSRLHKFVKDESCWSFESRQELALVLSTNFVDLIDSTTTLYEALESEDQRLKLFEELSLGLVKEFYEWISQEAKSKINETFGHIMSAPQSIEQVSQDLETLAKYYTCIEQILDWMIFWSNDMILILKTEAFHELLDPLETLYKDLQSEILESCSRKVIQVIKDGLWAYFKSKSSSRNETVHPVFYSCLKFLQTMMKILKDSISIKSYEAVKSIVLIELEKEMDHINSTDREQGWIPVISSL